MPGFGKSEMGKREVTEFDLRAPEFKHPDTKLEDLEFRADGKIVRKDRWERGIHSIAEAAGFNRREGFEIDDVVDFTEKTFAALEDIDHAYILDVVERASNVLHIQLGLGKIDMDSVNKVVQLEKDLHDAISILQQTVLKLAEAAPGDTSTD